MYTDELRIGSLVDVINRHNRVHLPYGFVKKVGGVHFFKVMLYEAYQPFATQEVTEHTNISDLSPIPLTEEWLLKFGLKNENGFFKWHRSAIYKRNEIWIYGILGDDNNSYYHVSELKCVHQLQNLYHALTGEELTLKA